jgi:mRNA-degrading endonuclease toxin of MazEF toxin-antitoxin module
MDIQRFIRKLGELPTDKMTEIATAIAIAAVIELDLGDQ